MEAHGLDCHLWEVLSYKSNFWQAQQKGGEKLDLYQTKIVVKPKKQTEITLQDIDNYFADKKYAIPEVLIKKVEYKTDGDTLIIKIPDLHICLLSWKDECGENYDLKIAKENFLYCIADVVDRTRNRKIKQVLLVTLGDILHVDNDNQTTTKGTFQQVDGRIAKIINCAETMFVSAIEMLKDVAPVKCIYTSGT